MYNNLLMFYWVSRTHVGICADVEWLWGRRTEFESSEISHTQPCTASTNTLQQYRDSKEGVSAVLCGIMPD